jgi:hypothetical protein
LVLERGFSMYTAIENRRLLIFAIIFALSIMVCMGMEVGAQDRYENVRGLIARTQDDLRRIADLLTREKKDEKERIDNTQKHLSEFDRELSRNKFDKDKLDTAIDDLKNVVAHNTLAVEDRDLLNRDLEELRQMRSVRGR